MTCKNNQMPIPNIQLNSKFVNNMSPEWDRFVTAVKLNKGLKETNHEQLVQPYSQPSQSQSHQYQSSTTPSQSQNVQSIPYSQFVESSSLDTRYTQTEEILNTLSKQFALLTQSFSEQPSHRQTTNFEPHQYHKIKQLNKSSDMVQKCSRSTETESEELCLGKCLDEEELHFLAGELGNTFEYVPSSEEDLELAELTRQKMHEKLNDPVCVEKGIKCIPPNYSKENFLATFTPQTKLTPEQYVCWFLDLAKRKTERVKANAPPLPVLPPATVYPPNTPVSICPPSNAFQPQSSKYSKFDVITHYIWTLKRLNAFDGVKKSLVTEVRAMKAVFEEMEAKVDQNAIDKKYGEIERKNLLITNENLIANCIAQDVFYTVTDSTLSASRFNDLSTAYNAAMNRINHELFSKLEVAHVNLHLKQHLKENANNLKSKSPRDVLEFDVFFELGMRDDQIQSHKNTIRKLKAQISELKANKSENNRYHWKSTGRIFPLGDQCPLTRITKPKALPVKQWKPTGRIDRPLVFGLRLLKTYDWRSLNRLKNFRKKSFIRTVRFGNDHFGAIMGYGDYVIGDSVISRVYYVEGLRHNLFSVEQSLVVTSSVESLKNFGTLNDLARKDLVRGLPRLKFEKDHLCSACQLGKSRKVETDIKQKDKKKAKITKPSTGWKRQSNQGQSQSKSKDSQVEETQLEGLKLPTSSSGITRAEMHTG
ncbi:hypothetical protein Tco_0667767 [Tanacetum coccineum]